MLKKTITYIDYNDVERTEDFYFNLSEAELAEMELSIDGGYAEMIQKLIKENNQSEIVKIFKDFILKTYGEKSLDGKYFNKEDENGHKLSSKFKQTPAYSVLYMELATDAEKAAEFVNFVIPHNKSKENNN